MKKNKLLFALIAFLCFSVSQKANAQISKVTVVASYDSLGSYCNVPTNSLFSTFGNVTGTFTPTDSLTVKFNFDDGSDTTFKTKIFPISGGGEFSFNTNHRYTFVGTFKPKVKVIAPSGIADSVLMDSLLLTNTCGTINGRLYIDANGNCVRDISEKNVLWTPILAINTVTKDSFLAGWANDTGYYSVNLLPGTYTIVPNPVHYGRFGYWTDTLLNPSCPSSGTYSLTVSAGSTYSKDFAYTCKTMTTYDASVNVWSRGFVPGDSTYVCVTAGSWYYWYFSMFNCATMSTTVTLTLDPKLTYLSSLWGKAPSSISGSTVTWNLSSASEIASFNSSIWVKVPSTATLGDTIRLTAYIAPTAYTDPNLTNNTINFKKAISSSYDPNMKEVSPTGYGTVGYIAPNTDLTYTIHFQNTGTAAAKNVTITDIIDADLDINSLHILHSTHNASLNVDGSTVKFRFSNINLPDSGSNMNASMGAITYGIKQKNALASGTKINNTAAIYF
jgi:uncharacterized repeat protein (TIGR01451 family)